MEILPIIIGLALIALLAYSGWRWFHAGGKKPDAAPPDFVPTVPATPPDAQPLDGGPVPTKPK